MSGYVFGSQRTAFSDAFDMVCKLRHDFQGWRKNNSHADVHWYPITFWRKYKGIDYSGEKTHDRSLSIQECLSTGRKRTGFTRSEHNLADCLTEANSNDSLINTLKMQEYLSRRISGPHRWNVTSKGYLVWKLMELMVTYSFSSYRIEALIWAQIELRQSCCINRAPPFSSEPLFLRCYQQIMQPLHNYQ